MPNFESFIAVSDLKLAAALFTLDCPIYEDRKANNFKDPNSQKIVTQFNFVDCQGTTDLIAKWKDEKFIEANPDHALVIIKKAFFNREKMLDFVKHGNVTLFLKRGGSEVVVTRERREINEA